MTSRALVVEFDCVVFRVKALLCGKKASAGMAFGQSRATLKRLLKVRISSVVSAAGPRRKQRASPVVSDRDDYMSAPRSKALSNG